MMDAVDLDIDPDGLDSDVSIDSNGIIRSLTQLARSKMPDPAETIKLILSSIYYKQDTDASAVTKTRPSNATVEHRRDRDDGNGGKKKACEDNTEWQCIDCDGIFSSKSYLDRHVKNEHSVKRRKLVHHEDFECEECDYVFATAAALKNHETKHASCSNAPKNPKYKCDFCDKERLIIENHYESVHKIKNSKQIFFYNGKKLVRSGINTQGGKAPWFVSEKRHVTKCYKVVTCRLCENKTNFDSIETLEVHYTLYHMVDPSALNRLNFVFRAKEGSHLGLSASEPNPRYSNVLISTGERAHSPRVDETKKGNIKWICRLCDRTFSNKANLKRHVIAHHEPKIFTDLAASQTANKRKHQVESSQPQRFPFDTITELNRNAASSCAEHKNKKVIIQIEKKDVSGSIMYQCERCEVATTSYDATVEHAQLHYLEGYRPITETCDNCKFAFEAQCYAEHSNNDHDTERKILRYNPSNLLNDEWFAVFQSLPATLANQIKSSSIYEHTRAVKINSDEVSGIPLYQCGMCELYVHPKEVEDHCNNKNACVKNKSQNYYCSICDIFFFTSLAIIEHDKEHNNDHGVNSFRKVTFNCIQDGTINRALQKISSKSCSPGKATPRDVSVRRPPVEEVSIGTQRENRQPIEILEDLVVSVFCEQCNESIMFSEFEAHAATHKSYQNISIENQGSQIMDEDKEEIYVDSHNHECVNSCSKDIAPQNEAAVIMDSNEGTVKRWNSDDSCHNPEYNTCHLQHCEVHTQKHVKEALQSKNKELVDSNNQSNNNVENLSDDAMEIENNKSGKATIPKERNVQCGTSFTEEMKNDLRCDLDNLLQEIESDISESYSAADKNHTTQDLVNILENKTEKMGKRTGNYKINESSQVHKNNEKRNNNEDKLPGGNEKRAIPQGIFACKTNENQKDHTDAKILIDMCNITVKTETENTIINNDANVNNDANQNASDFKNIIDIINLDTDDEDDDATSRTFSRESRMLTKGDSNDIDTALDVERQKFVQETERIRKLMFSRD